MMKTVMKAIVMKKNPVCLFLYYHESIHCLSMFADEEDNLSEDEVSANPVEGKYNLFQIQIKPK